MRIKRQATDWEKFLQNTYPIRTISQNIQRILKTQQYNIKQCDFKVGQRFLTNTLPKKIHRWQISMWKDAPQQRSSGNAN